MPATTAESVDTGGLSDLVGVYSGLGSGRLVILGGPGTGKTAAAIVLLVNNLGHRQSLSDEQRAESSPRPRNGSGSSTTSATSRTAPWPPLWTRH
jgi:hypothetical protein